MSAQPAPTATTGNNVLIHKACDTPVVSLGAELLGGMWGTLVRRYRCPKCQIETEDLVWVDA